MFAETLQGVILNKFHLIGQIVFIRFFHSRGIFFVESLQDCPDGSGFVQQRVHGVLCEHLVFIFGECCKVGIQSICELANGIIRPW